MSGGNWKEMFKAVQTGDFNLVEFHLKLGADPNYQHPEVMAAPLVESIRFNHMNIMKLLLEFGADPTIEEILEDANPMSVAREKQNKEAIKLLEFYMDKTS